MPVYRLTASSIISSFRVSGKRHLLSVSYTHLDVYKRQSLYGGGQLIRGGRGADKHGFHGACTDSKAVGSIRRACSSAGQNREVRLGGPHLSLIHI